VRPPCLASLYDGILAHRLEPEGGPTLPGILSLPEPTPAHDNQEKIDKYQSSKVSEQIRMINLKKVWYRN
jgi:hypothetical protein